MKYTNQVHFHSLLTFCSKICNSSSNFFFKCYIYNITLLVYLSIISDFFLVTIIIIIIIIIRMQGKKGLSVEKMKVKKRHAEFLILFSSLIDMAIELMHSLIKNHM